MNIKAFISHQNFVSNVDNASNEQHRKLQYHAELPGYAVNKKKTWEADYRTFLWQDKQHKFAISVAEKGFFLCYYTKHTPLTMTVGEQEMPITNGAVFIPRDNINHLWGSDGNLHEILHYAEHLMTKPVEVILRPKYATLSDSHEVTKHYWKIPIIRLDWWDTIEPAILLEWASIFDGVYLNVKVSENVIASEPTGKYILFKSSKSDALSLFEKKKGEGIYEYHYNNEPPKQYEHCFSTGCTVKVLTVGQHWLISIADDDDNEKSSWIAPSDMPIGGLYLGDSIESATEVLNQYATAIKLI